MFKIRRLFTRQKFDERMLSLEQRFPNTMLISASLAAGLGYIILGLFPVFTLIGIFTLIGGIGSASTLGAWINLFIWLLITATCGLITFTQLRARASIPSGLGLKDDKAPRLYEQLTELGENFKLPRIKRVVMHDKFSLEIIRVPRFGLPFLSTNVLYIGLPVLQGLSPNLFRGALAGKIGQHAAEQSKKTHWIYNCVQFFSQCQHAMRKHESGIYLPLKFFYRLYTPFLKYFSAGAVRQDNLEADIYMLEILNDTEVTDVILRYEVCKAFINNKYWPKIMAMLRKNPANPEVLPHINMAKVLRTGLTENEFAQTMNDLINQETTWRETKPCLHARLSNIGRTKLDMPPPVMETAAQRYLGEAFAAVVKLLDNQWQLRYGKSAARAKKNAKPTRRSKQSASAEVDKPGPDSVPGQYSSTPTPGIQVEEYNMPEGGLPPDISADDSASVTISERRRLSDLKQKADSDSLNDNEAWELAHLTEKLEDKALAIQLYQQVLKQNPNHAKTLFAIGRILLTRDDPTGVKILERAMELDKGCVAQGCWMLAKYFKSAGNDALSKKYLERAASISVAA